MMLTETHLKDVFILEPIVRSDNRGWFVESYSNIKLKELGININFVQDNHSYNCNEGVIRGLHYQTAPKTQTKLFRCTHGKLLDVVVDLREGSPTYKKWLSVELTAENKKQILIPKGFAHGYITLTDNVEVQYKVDEYYAPEYECSIRFDDPEIGIVWEAKNAVLSEKDEQAPFLIDSDCKFIYGKI